MRVSLSISMAPTRCSAAVLPLSPYRRPLRLRSSSMKNAYRFRFLKDERGGSLIELAFVLPLFPLLLFGAVDFARAFYLSVEVTGAAQAAATYGAQNPTDTAGMQSAATADAPN